MIDGAGGARPLDLRNPFDILDLQVTAAFENFQRVFFSRSAFLMRNATMPGEGFQAARCAVFQ